jgi:hypothetical protein
MTWTTARNSAPIITRSGHLDEAEAEEDARVDGVRGDHDTTGTDQADRRDQEERDHIPCHRVRSAAFPVVTV